MTKYYVMYKGYVVDVSNTKDKVIAYIERALENDPGLSFTDYNVKYEKFLSLGKSTQVKISIGE